MADELNILEKATLLAFADHQNKDDHDQDFYDTMCQTEPPDGDEIDDEVRRAIYRFVSERDKNPLTGGYFIVGFMHGYMVGRKLRRDIRRKK